MTRVYKWEGKTLTLQELAKLAPENVSAHLIDMRLRNGWPLKKAVTRPYMEHNARRRDITYMLHGKEYTLTQLCNMATKGLTRDIIGTRLRANWDTEQAITLPKGTVRSQDMMRASQLATRNRWLYGGRMWSAAELAEIAVNGLSAEKINNRLRSGWSVADAITLSPYVRRPDEREIREITPEMHCAMRWLAKYVVSSYVTIEGEAIERPRQTGELEITLDRKYYRWILRFHAEDRDRFQVICVFRNTEEISYPVHEYRFTHGQFQELARYDERGNDILTTRSLLQTIGGD